MTLDASMRRLAAMVLRTACYPLIRRSAFDAILTLTGTVNVEASIAESDALGIGLLIKALGNR